MLPPDNTTWPSCYDSDQMPYTVKEAYQACTELPQPYDSTSVCDMAEMTAIMPLLLTLECQQLFGSALMNASIRVDDPDYCRCIAPLPLSLLHHSGACRGRAGDDRTLYQRAYDCAPPAAPPSTRLA
jgi:hypothetical protein